MKKLFKIMMVLAIAIATGLGAQAQTIIAAPGSGSTALNMIMTPSGYTPNTSALILISGQKVAMPYTIDMPSTTFTGQAPNTAYGQLTYTWRVSGDIQIYTGSGSTINNSNPVLTATSTAMYPGTSTPIAIASFNSNQRNTAYDAGQGKGRVTLTISWMISYTPCNLPPVSIPQSVDVVFDVYKYGYKAPPVVGPGCIRPNTEYTYSVDPVISDLTQAQIGEDRYLWDLSHLGTLAANPHIYFSADSSSVTFTTGDSLPASPSIKCNFGICNFPTNNVQGQVESGLNLQIGGTAPVISATAAGISGAGPTYCIPAAGIGAGPDPLILTVTNAQAGATYTWMFGTDGGPVNGWNTFPAQNGSAPFSTTGPTLTIADIGNQPGTVNLMVTDACGNTTMYTYTFNRSIANATAGLISLSNTCTTPGTAITASLAASASLNNVTWTGTGFTVANGASTYTITPSGGLAPGIYATELSASLGCGNFVNYPVNIKPASLTTDTAGCVSPGSTNGGPIEVTSPSLCAGCTFAWSAYTGTGVTANFPTAMSSTLTTTGSPTAGSFTATYTVAAGCATTGTAIVGISAAAPAVTTTQTCFDYNTRNTTPYVFHVAAVSGATSYTWSVSPANELVTITGQGTTAASMILAATTADYTVSCVINTPCGLLNATPYTVNVAPLVANESVADATIGNQTFYALNTTPVGTYTYKWTENGATVGAGTTYTGTTLNTNGTDVCCTITSTSGCASTWCTMGGTYKIVEHHGHIDRDRDHHNDNETDIQSDLDASIHLYPNPNQGKFTLNIPPYNESAKMTVIDQTGREIFKKDLVKGDNLIEDARIASGQYLIHLEIDGAVSEKIVITEK